MLRMTLHYSRKIHIFTFAPYQPSADYVYLSDCCAYIVMLTFTHYILSKTNIERPADDKI